MLYDLVKEHRPAIIKRSSFGIYDGLLLSLMEIDRGGGASLRHITLDVGRGIVVPAAIVPSAAYIVSPLVETLPGPFLEPISTLPDLRFQCLSWRPSFFRVKKTMAIVPLAAVALPALPRK